MHSLLSTEAIWSKYYECRMRLTLMRQHPRKETHSLQELMRSFKTRYLLSVCLVTYSYLMVLLLCWIIAHIVDIPDKKTTKTHQRESLLRFLTVFKEQWSAHTDIFKYFHCLNHILHTSHIWLMCHDILSWTMPRTRGGVNQHGTVIG